MNITSYRSDVEKAHIFTTTFHDSELHFFKCNLIEDVRYQLASRIVDIIMEKISPALEKAFKEE